MGYADEAYLKAKMVKSQEDNIEEIPQEQIEVEYRRMLFLENSISLELPADAKEVSREAVEFVFYAENKPQYVIESEQTQVAYGYNYTGLEIADDDIYRFSNFAAKVLEQAGPGVKIRKIKNEKREGFHLSRVQFTSKGFDGGIYNDMFYVSLNGKLLINFIIIPSADLNQKRDMIEHMVQSFKIEGEQRGDNHL